VGEAQAQEAHDNAKEADKEADKEAKKERRRRRQQWDALGQGSPQHRDGDRGGQRERWKEAAGQKSTLCKQ
jgi:hypothetical protein